MALLLLAEYVYEDNLRSFLQHLGNLNNEDEICIDWRNAKTYVPGAIVALLAKIHGWVSQGKRIRFENLDQCSAFKYLQRMNFFELCGVEIEENFNRHAPDGRFVPITKIGGTKGKIDIGAISNSVATCIAPEGKAVYDADIYDDCQATGPYDYIVYSVSELVANVLQHSGRYGFIFAQHYPTTDVARFGIADCGMGVRKSFESAGSPHWFQGMSDLEALLKAMEPKVSCKGHINSPWGGDPVNAGVGLTLLRDTTLQAGGGFHLFSGTGCYSPGKLWGLSENSVFNGTLCAISIKRSDINNFASLLRQAKINTGLLEGNNNYSGNFQ